MRIGFLGDNETVSETFLPFISRTFASGDGVCAQARFCESEAYVTQEKRDAVLKKGHSGAMRILGGKKSEELPVIKG